MLYVTRNYLHIKVGKTLPSLQKDLPTLENAHQPIPTRNPQIRHPAASIWEISSVLSAIFLNHFMLPEASLCFLWKKYFYSGGIPAISAAAACVFTPKKTTLRLPVETISRWAQRICGAFFRLRISVHACFQFCPLCLFMTG